MERKKLLIADDSEMNRAILANILDQDYEIIEAADGREAIAALQVYHGEISALLLDIIMPEMDGFAVLEEMRAHGWLEEVPVIMISTETGTATIDHAFALGASDYISRPFATRIIRQPGIWVQHLTVFEPDDSMIEVAIAAVTPVLPEDPEDGKW